jgi:hypothetical protein
MNRPEGRDPRLRGLSIEPSPSDFDGATLASRSNPFASHTIAFRRFHLRGAGTAAGGAPPISRMNDGPGGRARSLYPPYTKRRNSRSPNSRQRRRPQTGASPYQRCRALQATFSRKSNLSAVAGRRSAIDWPLAKSSQRTAGQPGEWRRFPRRCRCSSHRYRRGLYHRTDRA